MISIQRAKEILNDPKLSDKQVAEIRDAMQTFVEIIFEQWQEDMKKKKLKNSKNV